MKVIESWRAVPVGEIADYCRESPAAGVQSSYYYPAWTGAVDAR